VIKIVLRRHALETLKSAGQIFAGQSYSSGTKRFLQRIWQPGHHHFPVDICRDRYDTSAPLSAPASAEAWPQRRSGQVGHRVQAIPE
jgi:hypothetical protein